jgi:hypothetical protein
VLGFRVDTTAAPALPAFAQGTGSHLPRRLRRSVSDLSLGVGFLFFSTQGMSFSHWRCLPVVSCVFARWGKTWEAEGFSGFSCLEINLC